MCDKPTGLCMGSQKYDGVTLAYPERKVVCMNLKCQVCSSGMTVQRSRSKVEVTMEKGKLTGNCHHIRRNSKQIGNENQNTMKPIGS